MADQSTKVSKATNKTLNDKIIFETREEDILCGKEKHCVSHPGSLNFRAVIDKYASKYQEAVTKQEKMNVTKEIYDSLGTQNSRFLKYNAKAEGWEELSSLLARDKISHALRFANREKKAPATASKPRSKKGHRRTGSDSSASTLPTVASELSVEDFDYLLDDVQLDFSIDADTTAAAEDNEPKPYAYPVYESAPPAAYHSYGQPYYPHPHAYGHGYYQHPQAYHHSYHYPQQHYAPTPQSQPQYEEMRPMDFPEKPHCEPPARKSSMDIDLSYLVNEPLMEWELEPEQVCMVNDQ